ncbi:hypothetical protein J2X97_000823 [Epilithonimonas hungarica]|nr:hypothetical protein [Epilithonimonas hungarica]MDP9955186.1 hypothetical protein [Epilithonimonas hungarica]
MIPMEERTVILLFKPKMGDRIIPILPRMSKTPVIRTNWGWSLIQGKGRSSELKNFIIPAHPNIKKRRT